MGQNVRLGFKDAAYGPARAARASLKRFMQRILQKNDPIYIVASFGRAGSTVAYDALVEALVAHKFPKTAAIGKRLVTDWCWDLGARLLYRGVVYKTHDFPEALGQYHDVKCLFLFGSPEEAALSVHSNLKRRSPDWVAEHFKHLKSSGSPDEIFDKDVLNFAQQIERWTNYAHHPVLCLRYEALWSHEKELSEFCGFPVTLPPKRPRQPKAYSSEDVKKVARTYSTLERVVNELEDCFVAEQSPKARIS